LADVCAGLRRYAGSLTAPAAGLALGAHHHLLGTTVAKLAKLTAVGARVKLVFAAVSVAAAGGLGVVSGPILAHLNPVTINADRGDVPGPPLLHAVSGTSGRADLPATHSTGSPFDPTMRSVVHGPQPRLPAGRPATTTVAPSQSTAAVAAQGGTPAGGTSANGGSTKTMQIQQAAATPTTDSVALSTTPAPIKGSGTSAPQKPHETVWSTSWTTNGTTVYETVWSWSDTVN
jgi:hypothetical protein